jgi:hypothetical protein
MQRTGLARIAIGLLVVFFTIQPALVSTVQWFCEGRVCGTQICCCEETSEIGTKGQAFDAKCLTQKSQKSQTKTQICQADCGCTPVFTASDNPPTTLTHVASFAPLVYVPWTPVSLSEPAIFVVFPTLQILDTRGPPVRTVALLPSGLRAPPIS